MNLPKAIILAYVLLLACSRDKPLNVDANSIEGEILLTMEQWGKSLTSGDIDATMEYYSESFTSVEAINKQEMRELLNEAKSYGMLWLVKIDLETADLKVAGDSAEIIIYNDDGEIEMDFALAKESNGWRIIGIPSEVCNYQSYSEPYGEGCISIDDHYRCWDIHVPGGLEGSSPLVIDFHGWTETASRQRSISGFETLSDSEGFIVAWPMGLCNSWNAGLQCCTPASSTQIDDVGFIRQMITELTQQYNIDPQRIYLTGLSNGCAMAQRMANEASDMIAAVACMSLHLLTEEAPGYRPVSVMTLMGTNDDLYTATDEMPGVVENFENWKEMNNCGGAYEVTWSSGKNEARTYHSCDEGTEVAMVSIAEGGHVLYKGEETEINTSKMAWDFMKRFTR